MHATNLVARHSMTSRCRPHPPYAAVAAPRHRSRGAPRGSPPPVGGRRMGGGQDVGYAPAVDHGGWRRAAAITDMATVGRRERGFESNYAVIQPKGGARQLVLGPAEGAGLRVGTRGGVYHGHQAVQKVALGGCGEGGSARAAHRTPGSPSKPQQASYTSTS